MVKVKRETEEREVKSFSIGKILIVVALVLGLTFIGLQIFKPKPKTTTTQQVTTRKATSVSVTQTTTETTTTRVTVATPTLEQQALSRLETDKDVTFGHFLYPASLVLKQRIVPAMEHLKSLKARDNFIPLGEHYLKLTTPGGADMVRAAYYGKYEPQYDRIQIKQSNKDNVLQFILPMKNHKGNEVVLIGNYAVNLEQFELILTEGVIDVRPTED